MILEAKPPPLPSLNTKMAGSGKFWTFPKKQGAPTTTSKYKAVTLGLENAIFEYGDGLKQSNFSDYIDRISGVVSGMIKHGGPKAAKAMCKLEPPINVEPVEVDTTSGTIKQKIKYKNDFKKFLKNEEEWEESNQVIYEKVMDHCGPTMDTKLKGMSNWEKVSDEQDRLGLIKMLCGVYFNQDTSKQAMQELVSPDKRLFLLWQQANWYLDQYTREFKSRAQVCENNESKIGTSKMALQIICAQKGEDYSALTSSVNEADIAKLKGIKKEAQTQYLVVLHFTGLNNDTWEELKCDVNNGWIVHKNDTMPKRIDQIILLCDKHERETKQSAAAKVDPTKSGVACIQPGKEEPGVAMAQPQVGPIVGKNVKAIVCWNPACNGPNHLLRDCPKAIKAQPKTIAAKKWTEFQQDMKAKVMEKKG